MATPLLHAKTHPPAKRLSLANSFNKTDAGNGSKAICRISKVLRSPSPDPNRSAKKNTMRCMILTTLIALALVGCGAKPKDEEVSADRFQKLYREVGTDTDKKKVEYIGQMDGVVEINVTLRDWADEWVIQNFWIKATDLPPAFHSTLPKELNLDQ